MCELYNKIYAACRERDVTTGKMCVDIGISKSTLSDLKSGRKKTMTIPTLQKIADYLKVTVDYLLSTDETENGQPDENDELTDVLQAARDDLRVRALFEEASKAKPEDIEAVTTWLRRLREQS